MFRPSAVVVVASVLVVVGCKRSRYDEVEVAASPLVSTSSPLASGDGVFRFGLAAMISPRETAAEYATVARELGAVLGAGSDLHHGKSYKEVNELLVARRLQVAFLCTGGYLELAARVPVEVLAVPRVDGKTTYHSLIIAGRTSRGRGLLDLRGQRFAFTDPLSLSGYLYPISRLRAAGFEPASFFARTEFLRSHDRSILAVQRNLADAAAVDSLIYEKLRDDGLADRLQVLERSPELGIPPVVTLASYTAAHRARWRDALLHLHERPTARAALARIGIERFVAPSPGLFASATSIWRAAQR